MFPRNWEGGAASIPATAEFTNFTLKSSPVKSSASASGSGACFLFGYPSRSILSRLDFLVNRLSNGSTSSLSTLDGFDLLKNDEKGGDDKGEDGPVDQDKDKGPKRPRKRGSL